MHSCALRLGLAATLVVGAPCAARAQVTLTLSQTPNVFPAPALADYNAGMITNPTGIAFSVNVTGGGFAGPHDDGLDPRLRGVAGERQGAERLGVASL